MKRKLWITASSPFLLGLFGACSNQTTTTNKESKTDKISVMTSFYPMYDFTKHVVGDLGEVEMLIPSGTEAHDYEPSAKDLKKIQDSDVFVYNNENMETWVPAIDSTLKEGKVSVIKATENLVLLPSSDDGHDHHHHHDEEKEEHSEEEHGHHHELDPHVWLAPNLAIKEVEEIRDQLVKAYPDKKEELDKNTEEYLKELSALDKKYETSFKDVKQPNFVTQHAAFGYLATEYGLNQVSIAGLSPDEEPSPARLAELKKYVKDNDIKYIYFESNANDAISKTLGKEAKIELLVLNTLEGLSEKDIKAGKDYVSVMEENLEALKKTTESTSQKEMQVTKEKEKTVHNGYFKDSDITERSLSNWAGDWQSVYPFVLDGTMDQVFDYKAKINKDKSAKEYKEYYTAGYKTDIAKISIVNNYITYTDTNGKSFSSEYKPSGYHILNYEKGNRGVRYCFEAKNPESGAFKYIQFSDHNISDVKAEHFHLYFGNESQEKLYDELENWPTYYSDSLSGKEIAQEMLAH